MRLVRLPARSPLPHRPPGPAFAVLATGATPIRRTAAAAASWLARHASNCRTCCTSCRPEGLELGAALRVLRQLVLARILERDCNGLASVQEVTACITTLAELALDAACAHARATLDARHGTPQGPQGQPVQLWVIGMGKLGARELNVSSDIDLIYVYEHEGETTGRDAQGKGCISNHEYFTRAVKSCSS